MYFPLSPYILSFLAIVFSSVLALAVWNGRTKKHGRRHPPSLPVLSLVATVMTQGVDSLADYFLEKSLQLGPMFTVAAGSRLCLVLNTKEVIEAALLKQPSAYAGREPFYTEKIFNRNVKGIGMRQFDEQYRRYHFMYMTILKEFGFGKRSLLESRISVEVVAMLDHLKQMKSRSFNPRDLTMRMISNVMYSIVFGRRCDFNEEPISAAREAVWIVEHMDAALDVLPILRFTPGRKRLLRQMVETNDRFVTSINEEIQKSLEPNAAPSFVSRVVDKEGSQYDKEEMVQTVRILIIAGTDTVLASMLWSYVLLANNPSVQERMQKEIDHVVPNGSLPSIEDQPRLPFVQATILEIMRRATVSPLSVPRITLKDTELCGYHIPAGTVVLPNLHAAHLDPRVWNDPEDFKPERFLDSDDNVARDGIIPFSVGRRACIGEELARHELFLFISGLVQHFTIKPPEGHERIEVTNSGEIIPRPSPFDLRMIPRKTESSDF